MPTYEYECQACGHNMEAVQRITESPLIECPACHQPRLQRLISATSFQLKGAAPRPVGPVLADMAKGVDADFTRVTLDCPGLAKAPFLELYAVRDGEPGVRLVSACKVDAAGYRAVLVDRGFVAQSISARPPVDAADTTPFSLTGVFRKPDKPSFVTPPNDVAGNHWYWRDHAAMAKALRTSAPAPQVLMAETPTNPDWKALVPAPVPADIPNRHLEYALTWFGLAAALARHGKGQRRLRRE